ncbi:diaminopimelate epimerase [Streptomyces sp. NPDC051993]|uniref:diaminopimelate epimerase n=1 Tax=Streptomyces sp. NPDC051993 TaxID=3155286 RepID=UPI003434E861
MSQDTGPAVVPTTAGPTTATADVGSAHAAAADFVKYEALGNDYIVIDPHRTGFEPSPHNVQLACDRHYGLGADGLLYGPLPAEHGFRLLTFNPDGTECGKSGNGTRIFARYLRESGYTESEEFTLHSAEGPATVHIVDAAAGLVRVDLGTASLDSRAAGASGPARTMVREPLRAAGQSWEATCVHLGTPHCVIPLVGPADEALARRVGAAVRDHELFPGRTNVELLDVIDRENIRIEIFERVAGYTLASGSSACAAAYAAHTLGLTGPHVTVHMPGGQVGVDIDGAGRISLVGEVHPVLQGRWAPRIARLLSGRAAPA